MPIVEVEQTRINLLPVTTQLTRLAFLSRFTDAEAVKIDLVSQGASEEAAYMRRYLAKVDAATFIDLNNESTRAAVFHMEESGLLEEGRASEILDAPVQDAERL